MPSGASQNRVLHNDALAANGDGPALSDDLRAEHHATAGADGNVAADEGIRRDPGRGIDSWGDAIVCDEHVVLLVKHRPNPIYLQPRNDTTAPHPAVGIR